MKLLSKIFLVIIIFLFACERENTIGVDPIDTAPNVPTGLSIFKATDGFISLAWNNNKEDDIHHYNIYRSTGADSILSKSDFTNDNFYIDDSLEYEILYNYKISAVDDAGNESTLSHTVTAKPINRQSPLPPFTLRINARNWGMDTLIYLNWIPSEDFDIAHYNIYRDTLAGFEIDSTDLLKSINAFEYSDRDSVQLNKNYFYKIISVDKGGLESNPSEEFTDLILDKAKVVFPLDSSTVSAFSHFRIKAVSVPAEYKIEILTNPYAGIYKEIYFSSNEINKVIDVNYPSNNLLSYKTYFVRVVTFTNGNTEPNSISSLSTFTLTE